MCSLLCCFGCLTLFGFRDRVCQKLVYFPPAAQYSVEVAGEGKETKQTMWMLEENTKKKIEPHSSSNFHCAMVKTSRGESICTMHIAYPGSRTMLLFSHGNATDIGCMRDHLIDLSVQLGVNIFAYDYCGYGLSTGKPNQHNTYADAEAAYSHMTRTYPDQCQCIILYGQSLGSGPTLHLAKSLPVNGVVIHSGLMSGLRVLKNVPDTRWFDIYPNIDNVKKVKAPVFVIHGTEDREVPVHHGKGLAEAAPNPFKPYWVEGAGHNNIEIQWRSSYLHRLRQFVGEIERTHERKAVRPSSDDDGSSPSSPSSNGAGRGIDISPPSIAVSITASAPVGAGGSSGSASVSAKSGAGLGLSSVVV